MDATDDIPQLLEWCQQDTNTRGPAQLALEQYRSLVLKLAYGPGSSDERKEACEQARKSFEFQLRNILVPFFDELVTPAPKDHVKDNDGPPPASNANG